MAYANAFDPTTPSDTDPAAQGDDEIRRVKAALIERLDTVFSNFPDGDPLQFQPGILQGADQDTASYLADNAAGTKAAAIADPAVILFLKVTGTTDASGGLTVNFDEAGFAGKYQLAKLQTVLASQRAGAATGTRVTVNTGTNTLVLDTDYVAATAVSWDLMLVFLP